MAGDQFLDLPMFAPSTLPLTPLSQSTFAPYGLVLDADGRAGYPINQGSTTRMELGVADVLANDGKPCLSLFRASACKLPLRIRMLERHNSGSQTFIPLNGASFIAVVALGEQSPDLSTLAAFHVDGARGLTLARGVWHHPLLALQNGDFIVLERQGAAPDCDLCDLPQPYRQLSALG